MPTVKDLLQIAKALDIKGRHKMRKAELEAAIAKTKSRKSKVSKSRKSKVIKSRKLKVTKFT